MILPYKKCPTKCGFFILDNCPICGKFLEEIPIKERKEYSSHTDNLLKFQKDIYNLLYPAASEFADCSTCGICCLYDDVPLITMDINSITKGLKISNDDFIKQYTQESSDNTISNIMMNQPCSFLKDNRCIIYPHRPMTCQWYPLYFIPGFPAYLEIRGIEWCMLSTHFYHGLLEFYPKYQPELDIHIKKIDNILETHPDKNKGRPINVFLPVRYIYKYLQWLNSESEDEYKEKVKDLPF